LAKGAVKAVEFMHTLGMEKVESRCRYLSDYLREKLLKFGDAVQILTPKEKESHAGILGFRLNGRSSHDFFNYARVNKYRIRFVPESGLNSLRVSTHIYNNEDEMDGFADVLKSFMAKY
jgi:selenocysteine lyase/cysteine desulfurase